MSGPTIWDAVARRGDPETSWDAAHSIPSERIRRSQAFVLHVLRTYGPMTDVEILEHIDADSRWRHIFSPSGARTRRSELVDRGLVADSGKRSRLASGRYAIVWRAI